MKRFTPPVEGNVRSRTDFLISSVLVQICWILLLYLFMHSSAYAHTNLHLSDGRLFQTTMCDNVVEGGEIRGNETGCDDPVFDPTLIENVSLPTGGSGTLEYLWIFTTDDPDGEFSVWTPIMNTNSPSYNPPAITETTHYRRCARRSGCEDYVAESNYVTKEVACCDNVTDGGAIRMDQTFCGNVYDPDILVNVSLPTGGSGDLEYLWFESNVGPPFFPDNPNWTEIIGSNSMNYDPGLITQTTYYIRCSRRSGCTTFTGESNIIRITLSDPPNLNIMVTPPNCPNQNSGSIRLQVIGGMTPFNYTWTGGIGNTGNPTNLSAGTYAVTVTDANGCETNTQITLNDPPALQLNLSSTDAGCGNANNGSATAAVTGGTAPYSYQWNDEDNSTTATVNNLGAGNYRVIVTDRNGCSRMGSVTIDANEDFDLNIAINNADCAGQNTGSATVTPNGGIAPYTYQWNDPAEQTTSTATNLAAGSYFVSVFDANSCLTIGNVMIEEPTELNVTLSSTAASCEGGNNGTATASVTGGTPPYTYQWDDLARQTTATATNLAPGVYRLTTTDANGCIDKSQVTVGGATGFEVKVIITNADCNDPNSGSAMATVSTGSGSYAYQWNTNATTQSITDLAAGNYTVTVTDNNTGCSAIASGMVESTGNLNLTISKNDATCGANNGSATANVMGGAAPYTYIWSNNQTTRTISNLAAGNYSVTVADNSGCTATANVQILDDGNLNLIINKNDATCGLNNGAATVSATGGTAPYNYRWSNNQTTPTINNLAAGTYTVTVTDNRGCMATASVQILGTNNLSVAITQNNASCAGGNNGSATANPTNGTAPYTYRWSNNATTQTINNLAPGNYAVTVTDANGCTATASTQIMASGSLELKLTVFNVSCNDLTDGEIRSNVSGGQTPYTYQWSNNATTSNINNLPAGVYALTVTDVNGCQDVKLATVEEPANLIATTSTVDANCGQATGEIAASVGGGTAPYSFRWNDANNSTTQVVTNVATGTYTVTVTDANGCTTTAVGTVNDTPNPTVTITKNDALCNGDNGSATANANGGTAPYTYSWSNNQTTRTINNLASGNYTVTVTDSNGCIATATTTIQTSSNPSVTITTTDENCDNQDGKAAAAVTSGTSPYTYRWSNGQTTSTALNLAAGTYTVTVTDANGCMATASATVNGGNPVVATIMPGATSICAGETVQFTATPNASNFTYQWTATGGSFNNPNVANPTYSMIQPGTYTITVRVRRDDGCEDTATTTVTVNANPNVIIQPPAPDLCGGGSIDFVADVSGGVNGLTYEWAATGGIFNNNTLAEPTYTMNQIGTYVITVTVMNASGCTATAETTITINEEPTCDAVITSDYDGLDISTNNGNDGSASVNVAGGSGNYTYRWSNGQTTQSINNLGPGSYRVTVTDGNSCQCISSVRLRDAAKIGNFVWNDIDKDGVQDANEPGIPNVLVTLTGTDINSNDVTRSVRTDATGMYMFDGLVPGDYKLTFTQPNGFRPTEQNQGGNDATDSDIDPITGMTQVVTLDYGDYDETLDAGYFDSGVNVGDYVFIDSNRNGIQDPDERGLSDVILVLIDKGADNIYGTSDDRAIDQTSTDFFGFYLFEDVPVGNYVIQIVRNSLPRDFQLTTQNAGNDDAVDSDFDVNTLASDMFMVNETQADDLTHDAGVFGVCDNVTDPGEIAADEDVCGAGSIPSLITSVRDATGGGGVLEYLWMRSTVSVFNGFNDPNWEIITGATNATYQPGQIYETTYYIRCSRRANCPDYRETNIVQKKVIAYPTSDLESGSTTVCINESTTYVAEIGGFGNVTYDWHFGDNAVPQTASGRAATVRWTTSGTKVVSLNVIQDGCANYTTYEIIVSDCPGLLGNFTTVEAELTPASAVDLMWMTDGEPVNTNYVIQRANADGSKFETIDLMPAKGEKAMQTYHCVDKQPNIGKNYYRVKHFDLNGGFAYSNVVEIMVQPQGTKDIIFYPNPFRDRTTLQVVAEVETDVQVQIVSTFGQVIDVQTVPLGTNFYDLDLTEYPKGVYYVYVTYNGYRKVSYRLLKTDDN